MEQEQYLARIRVDQEWEDRLDWLNQNWEVSGEETSQERRARQLATQESVLQQAPSQQVQESLDLSFTATMQDTQADEATSTPANNNGKESVPEDMDVDQEGPPKTKKKRCSTSTRTFVKQRGRLERIANRKLTFKFDKYGTGSTPDKAFDVSP